MTKMKPVHPGEVLRADFLTPMGITPYRLAKDIDVPVNRITGIVNEARAISADTAARIAKIRASEEGREGVLAFLEKRRPEWGQGQA